MPTPLFLLLLAGGSLALYRHLVLERRAPAPHRLTINGHIWLLRPGIGFTDIYAPAGSFGLPAEVFIVRYQTDTKKPLVWSRWRGEAGNQAVLAAATDFGISRES